MNLIKNKKKLINDIYIGIFEDTIDDVNPFTIYYFAVLKKIYRNGIGIACNQYSRYKDVSNNNKYYISGNGDVIPCSCKELNSNIKCTTKISGFYPLKDILYKAKELLKSVALTNEISLEYLEKLLTTEFFINKNINNEKLLFNSRYSDILIDNLEEIHNIAVNTTEESLVKIFSNQLAEMHRLDFTVIKGNKTLNNKNTSKEKKHNLILIKNNQI